MAKITKEDLKRLAFLSRLRLRDDEVEPLREQIEGVLSYAQRVQEVAQDVDIPSHKNINFFEQDVVHACSPEPLMEQAPETEAHLFVVPKIIESK